jgi:phosphatidylglycerophosphate synthase
MPLTPWFALKASACFAVIALVVAARISPTNHPYVTFGPANWVTMVRGALVALVAGVIGEARLPVIAAAAAAAAIIATLLDGLDGWLARRSGMSSAFGARFDMEVDALLILALSILAWRYDKAGAWVIASGLLRYLFVVAGWIWPWMERPLEPSRRRQTVCVIQIVALIAVVLPAVTPPMSTAIAAAALAVLAASFLIDTSWLVLHRREQVA